MSVSVVKVFNNGGSQAIRLPKECRFKPDQKIAIHKIGEVVLMVPEERIDILFESGFGGAGPDFFVSGWVQDLQDERDPL